VEGAGGSAVSTSTADARLSTGTASSTAFSQAGTLGAGTTLAVANATSTAETKSGQLASALAVAKGGSGTASSTALSSGGIVTSLTATASAPTVVSGEAGAQVGTSAFTSGNSYSDNAYASAGIGAAFSGLGSHVGTVFDNSQTVDFGTGAVGGVYGLSATGAVTYSSSITWDVATGTLPSGGDLVLGLVSGSSTGAGFTDLKFTVTTNAGLVLNENFTTVAAANTFFTDNLQNLGLWATGVTGTLDVTIKMTETLNAVGNTYGAEFMLGATPVSVAALKPMAFAYGADAHPAVSLGEMSHVEGPQGFAFLPAQFAAGVMHENGFAHEVTSAFTTDIAALSHDHVMPAVHAHAGW